jgi:hypothetical protein
MVWRCPSVRLSVCVRTLNATTVERRNFIPHGSRMFLIDFKVTGSKVKVTGGHVKTLSELSRQPFNVGTLNYMGG